MTRLIFFLMAALMAWPSFAQESADPAPAATAPPPAPALEILDAHDVSLDDFLWEKRLLVVFADTERNPAFRKQMEAIRARPRDLIERDVVVLFDTDPANPSEARERLRPHGFVFVLIGKDGIVALRKPVPWETREIARTIDKMPLRQDEIRQQLSGG